MNSLVVFKHPDGSSRVIWVSTGSWSDLVGANSDEVNGEPISFEENGMYLLEDTPTGIWRPLSAEGTLAMYADDVDGVVNSLSACAVLIQMHPHESRYLVGHRSSSSNLFPGALQTPGGWVKPGETLPQASQREMLEETGLRVKVSSDPVCTMRINAVACGVFHASRVDFSDPVNREPEKCDGWEWMGSSKIAASKNLHPSLRRIAETLSW